MFGTNNLAMFFAASVVVWLTPGMDTVFILSRTVAQGRRAGILSALGIGTGSVVHTLLAALGLSAILAASATAFLFLKFAGALYLAFLGVQALRRRGSGALELHAAPRAGGWTIYCQGILSNLFNPKVAIFYLAFLPQFVAGSSRGPLPFVFLGLIFVVGGTLWCLTLAWIGAAGTQRLRDSTRVRATLERLLGWIYIALAVNLLRTSRS